MQEQQNLLADPYEMGRGSFGAGEGMLGSGSGMAGAMGGGMGTPQKQQEQRLLLMQQQQQRQAQQVGVFPHLFLFWLLRCHFVPSRRQRQSSSC